MINLYFLNLREKKSCVRLPFNLKTDKNKTGYSQKKSAHGQPVSKVRDISVRGRCLRDGLSKKQETHCPREPGEEITLHPKGSRVGAYY
jgi:hypothetical protein